MKSKLAVLYALLFMLSADVALSAVDQGWANPDDDGSGWSSWSVPAFIGIPIALFLLFLMSTFMVTRITMWISFSVMVLSGIKNGGDEYLWMGLLGIGLCLIGAKIEKAREKK